MGLMDRAREFMFGPARADMPLPWDTYQNYFRYGTNTYGTTLNQTLVSDPIEKPDGSWASYINLFAGNPVIYACLDRRLKLFSEARFQYRQMRDGRPGDLFGKQRLAPLETPWPNATTGDLLARAIMDADLAGNFYAIRIGSTIHRLRPDWVTIVLGSIGAVQIPEVAGYLYHPKGPNGGVEPVVLLPRQVAHFAPTPDPSAAYRGMSWITPVINEVIADQAATLHKAKFFENGATPNMVLKSDITDAAKFKEWVRLFNEGHRGAASAYETIFLGGGFDATVVGADMKQLDFKATQGAGETRIAAAAGVPPIIVGLSEGLNAATYSNYGQARRAFADLTMRPLWRNFAGSIASIVDVPDGAELWYDDRDIPFLAEDQKDAAAVQAQQAASIRSLTDAGFDPNAVIDAVTAGDLKRLSGHHSNLFSVQLQPPNPDQPKIVTTATEAPPT